MVDFIRKRTHASDSPKLVVDPGLAVGAHNVELVVINAAGKQSPPLRIRFEIVRGTRVRSARSGTPRRNRNEP